ncbi:MAG: DUF3850 domain-containing protein [Methanosarcinales archaeon]|jgi:hypothetical protein|nr:DUF3850 domain-containing protein [Methanosarcinales archaeon]
MSAPEERLSGLSFKEAFNLLEYLYFKEKKMSESHHFHVYKIRDFWYNEIHKGKLFEIRKDDRESVPVEGDVVCLMSSLHYLFVKVTYVLNHNEAPEYVSEDMFIFGFEIICELPKSASAYVSWAFTTIDNLTDEFCQHCGGESEIPCDAVGTCADCGVELFPCSACSANLRGDCSWNNESKSCDFFKHTEPEKSGDESNVF